MSTQIALIRGINVGRAKRVAMGDLRVLVEDLGHGDVRTLLNSGNVVFTSTDAAERAGRRIEVAMTTQLGVSAKVIVITAKELAAIIEGNTLAAVARDPSRLLIGVLARAADRARVAPLLARKWSPEAFALGPRAAYMWCPNGILHSALGDAVSKALGDSVTSRNWATMTRLHALAGGARPTRSRAR